MKQDLREVIEYLRDKNICLLGNAKSALMTKKDIDKFDVVCRCNRGYPKGKEDYIGRRTDVLFLSTTIKGGTILHNYNPKYVIWMTVSNHLASEWVHKNAYQNPAEQYKELKDKLTLRPTTGCISFNFLINNVKFKSLTLYGFDFFANGHYHRAHKPSEEKAMIIDIINKTSNIKLHIEEKL